MDTQTIINLAGGAILTTLGWFARQIWDSVQALKDDIRKIEVELPTNYVRRVDLDARFDRIEATLERIFDKLEAKADK